MSIQADLARLGGALDLHAPPIGISEVLAHSRGVTITEPAPTEESDGAASPRWAAIAAGGLVAASIIGGLLVFGQRDAAPVEVPAPTTLPTPPTQTPTRAPVTTATAPPTAIATAPTVPSRVDVAAVRDEIASALANVESFRATATITQRLEPAEGSGGQPHDDTTTNVVTLFGNGAMWAETEDGGFASYDPATGGSRVSTPSAIGGPTYQEIVGWADNTTGMLIMLGHDPAPRLDAIAEGATITQVSHDGRPAWQFVTLDGVHTYVIDRGTGLVVVERSEMTSPDGRELRESALTGLETAVALPATYPGTFPDGAAVDRSGDPNGFQLLSLTDAAAAFGTGFVAPAELSSTTRISVQTSPIAGEGGVTVVGNETTVTLTTPVGFAKTEVIVYVWRAVAGVDPGLGMIAVDGNLCFADADGTCRDEGATDAVVGGAMAGWPTVVEGGIVSVGKNGIRVSVRAPRINDAVLLANTFVAAPS